MIVERIFDEKLAQAGFLVGCEVTGEAIAIDPNRDIARYLSTARERGLRIVAVAETHIHADFVSGGRELAQVAGAILYLSDEGDADWKYEFAHEPFVRLVRDGDSIPVGTLALQVMATPGHTPEHVVFVAVEQSAPDLPLAVFSGDFLFVGDVGRPDLLERAAGQSGTMEAGARALFQSLRRFAARMPDAVRVWPSHGAGSACGKALGAAPWTTLGAERAENWAFAAGSEEEFVREVLADQPEPPAYFHRMKLLNRAGPPVLGGVATPSRLSAAEAVRLIESGAMILDVRESDRLAHGFLPQSIHVPADRSFPTWAGALVRPGAPLHILADQESQAEEAARDLARIGLDEVAGWFSAEALAEWRNRGGTLEPLRSARMADLPFDGSGVFLDVRDAVEVREGRIPGSVNIPLAALESRTAELPSNRPLYVYCMGGGRSSIGTALLIRYGLRQAVDVVDGFPGYQALEGPSSGLEASASPRG